MSRVEDQPQHPEESKASYDDLDLRAIASTDRKLWLPLVGGWQHLPIPGDLSIPTLARMLLIENKIEAAEAEQLEDIFTEAAGEIMRIVRVRTPDAPDPDMDEFGFKRISAALAWIAGDTTVADAFRATLTAGADPDEPAEPVATAHAASDEEAARVLGEVPGPLASNELSSTPSSSLDASTTGDQSGGKNAAGERSGSTSLTPASA